MKISPITRNYKKAYTFGTLVTNASEYDKMKQSFIDAGFTESDCEYLYIDNINGNTMCGFQGLNEVLKQAKGKYIILLHQDITAVDSRKVLEEKIKQLDEIDPNWALLGTSGASGRQEFNLFGTDIYGKTIKVGKFPSKVYSLDEVFILTKNEARLSFSRDVTGFHYYGVDICTIADIIGYSAYVIDYNTIHVGSNTGRQHDFFQCQNRVLRKYRRALRDRFLQLTCNILYLMGERKNFDEDGFIS